MCIRDRSTSCGRRYKNRNAVTDPLRNPFGVLDVPDPNGADVQAFASRQLDVSPNDANARSWTPTPTMLPAEPSSIEGVWHSRWNGGATGLEWKQGSAEIRIIGANVFLLFRWGEDVYKRQFYYDANGNKHFKPECFGH